MKLRNKRTGEILDSEYQMCIRVNTKAEEEYIYAGSIAELNEDWEDYKPAEPLIKDENIRKVFREWADLFGAERFLVNHLWVSRRKTTSIGSTDITTEPSIELPGHIGKDFEIYTRVELCGEEE